MEDVAKWGRRDDCEMSRADVMVRKVLAKGGGWEQKPEMTERVEQEEAEERASERKREEERKGGRVGEDVREPSRSAKQGRVRGTAFHQADDFAISDTSSSRIPGGIASDVGRSSVRPEERVGREDGEGEEVGEEGWKWEGSSWRQTARNFW